MAPAGTDPAPHHHHDQKHSHETEGDHHHHHEHGHDHKHDKGGHSHADLKDGEHIVMPDGRVLHSHDGLAPHSHEPIESPGLFLSRAPPITRDYTSRSFTVGIGGPVGTGKTALMLALCRSLRDRCSLAAVTNDIFTREDGEFLLRNKALPAERIRAVQTGGCPHAAIREDISINLAPLEELTAQFNTDLLVLESGGDNLAANYSRELADFIIYIIDVAGGDKIPRKGGPGITQADLLIVNKTDLAEAVGADLGVMRRDGERMRDGGPMVFAQVKHGVGVDDIVSHILGAWEKATGKKLRQGEPPVAKKQKKVDE